MKRNLYETVQNLLKQDKTYISEDNKLLKQKVYEDCMTIKPELISLLLTNEKVKEEFFVKVNEILVFDKQKFSWFINSKEFLPDSYTKYKNKIGLTSNGEFISKSEDVVLDFPYKDCYLQGGQTKDDDKRNEIMFNEIIAKDEITRMLEPKVLTNAKRYTKDEIEENIEFRDDDNLIIKGNNLIALSSILKRYEGKVKCIYIDPPYNTGSDSFNYNDNFNHSSWLTFMKNRLILSKKILNNEGFIFIEIDSNESHYLKCLCDEIFGRENFINEIIWKRRGGSANPQNRLNVVTESIFAYSMTTNSKITTIYSKDDDNTKKYIKERFTNKDKDGRTFMKSPIQSPNYRENLIYDYKGFKTPKKGYSISKEVMKQWDKEGKLFFPDSKDKNINRKIYLDEYVGQPISNLWTDIKVINPMANERLNFDGQKPEALIKRIIEMCTTPNDLVLDFHVGTGTTAAVAHKMNRQYIGIEQMNYINTITVPRLQKVIEGEQGGISKSVNWQGGGSFVYCELKENAQELIDKIIACTTDEEIMTLKESIYSDERIIPYITSKDLYKAEEDFINLSLENKKQALIEIINKNKLYVNYSDLENNDFHISESEKKFTESFYNKKEI